MSRNNYLGKQIKGIGKSYEINKKYNKDILILNPNDNDKSNIPKKAKVKLKEKKKDIKGKIMQISDEENFEYIKENSKKKEDENKKEDNIKNEEKNKVYINKIKELENTINKMKLDLSKEIEKHKNEIIEKEKIITEYIPNNFQVSQKKIISIKEIKKKNNDNKQNENKEKKKKI